MSRPRPRVVVISTASSLGDEATELYLSLFHQLGISDVRGTVAGLTEVVDGRKWRFEVEVREGDKVLGVGTHERRVVARA